MHDVEPALEGAVIAILLRIVFRFDADLWIACICGVSSRLVTLYFGPQFVAPDWWAAELVITGAVTMALLGALQMVRATG